MSRAASVGFVSGSRASVQQDLISKRQPAPLWQNQGWENPSQPHPLNGYRLWNYCSVLRDDGMSYCDYVEQLTYLLFLKMDDEGASLLGKRSAILADHSWRSLVALDGAELKRHYRDTLLVLGQGSGLIPVIFRKAENKIRDPAKLRRLIDLIDGETWIGLGIDVKVES